MMMAHRIAVPPVDNKPSGKALPFIPAPASDHPENAVDASTCTVYPGLCTEAGEHDDHSNHSNRVLADDGSLILDIGFVSLSGDEPHEIVYLRNEDFEPSQVRAKTAELRRLLDLADAMADELMAARQPQA
ncbi:hypothetical protein ACFY2G_04330 [Streptomyces collinus]|uniref:hypothetical protein n=1 Tax=Streptomyces collinus TaxID=42684 RepID=UPI0036A14CEA